MASQCQFQLSQVAMITGVLPNLTFPYLFPLQYFVTKFEKNPSLEHSFENYFSVAAMVPNVLMFFLNTLFKHK